MTNLDLFDLDDLDLEHLLDCAQLHVVVPYNANAGPPTAPPSDRQGTGVPPRNWFHHRIPQAGDPALRGAPDSIGGLFGEMLSLNWWR